MNDITKFAMIEAMRNYGGSFVVALANCFMLADSRNFDKLCAAFPEYVQEYVDKASKDAARNNHIPTALRCRQK